jgi:hypothetical protein
MHRFENLKMIVTVVLFSVCTNILGQERITMNAFGFSVMPPEGWFISQNDKAKDNFNQFDLTEVERGKLLKGIAAGSSFVAVHKYDPNVAYGMIPTVNIMITPTTIKTFESFKKSFDAPVNYPDIIQNYKTVSIKEVILAGNKALQVSNTYDIKDPTGVMVPLKNKTTYFYFGTYFISITFVEQVGKEDNADVYDAMLQTILLTVPGKK